MNARTWGRVALQPLVAKINITTRNTWKNEPEKLFFLTCLSGLPYFSVC